MADGDIRVLMAMNVVLSLLFSYVAVTAMDLAGITEASLTNILTGALFLVIVTYVVVLRE